MESDYVPDYEHCVLPYVQFYQDDFLGGVRGMRAHEIGIYTMLLMEMYARGRALDLPENRLARLCGVDLRTFRDTLHMLIDDGKIIRLDCGLWNERCENSFSTRAKMLRKKITAGHESGRKRSKNNARSEQVFSTCSAGVELSSEAQNTSANALSAGAPANVRTVLFSEGLQSLVRQTGLPERRARQLVGKWLKAAKDDAAKVLTKIRQAEADRVADAVAWVEAALKAQSEYEFIWARG